MTDDLVEKFLWEDHDLDYKVKMKLKGADARGGSDATHGLPSSPRLKLGFGSEGNR